MKLLRIFGPVVLILLALVFENAFNQDVYDRWIKPIVHIKIELFYILILGYFIYIFFDSYKIHQEQRISTLQQEIEQYKVDLNQETKGLWKQFSDLNRFNQQEIIYKTMNTFVDNQNNVMAVQLYNYVFKEGSKNTMIKVTHQNGYVAEGETLNALLQEHYTINSKVFRLYKNAMNAITRDNGIKLLNFVNKYKSELDSISINDLKGKTTSAINYSLILIGVQNYINFFTNQRTYSTYTLDILQNPDKEKILADNKRTGVFRGILNRELVGREDYIFFHIGDNAKKGRIYFTNGVKINGAKCVFLITLYNNVNATQILDKVNDLSVDFINLLKNNGVNVEENY